MFKGIKKILGIEGVVIDLVVPEEINARKESKINGILNLTAKGDSVITALEFKLIEKYKRGRKDSKLIDEYLLGRKVYNQKIVINKGESKTFPFELPFEMLHSDMDKLGRSNFMMKGIVGVAKILKGASSSYRIACKVTVEGTKLHPHAEVLVVIK